MSLLRIRLANKGVVILLQISTRIAPFDGSSTLAVIEIHRHVFAGVAIFTTIRSPTSIDKKFMLVHGTAVKIG